MQRAFIILLALAGSIAASPGLAEADGGGRAPRRYVPFDVTIVPPLNLFHFERKVIVGVSANVLYGRAAAVYGVEVGGLVNHEREAFGGIQVAGIANYVAGRATGIQLAGILNYAERGGAIQVSLLNAGGEGLSGIQLGAIGNVVESTGFQIQISPFLNNAIMEFAGLQISMVNITNQTLPKTVGSCGYNCEIQEITKYPDARTRGIVIGMSNLAQRMRGLQIAAVINLVRDVRGIQIAGLANASGDVTGLQVSPFNFGRDVRGVQIGAINVARRLRGIQLGAINIAYKNAIPVMIGVNAGF
jgi:hypothetical protein